jgi:hypothetical protein
MTEPSSMRCVKCQEPIPPDCEVLARLGSNRTARSYEDCIWRCEACGVGYSNARLERDRRMIHRSAEQNLPEQVHDGLDEVLDGAVNETARSGKRDRLAFETSEDAVTWVVVRALQQQDKLSALLSPEERADGSASLLLWGAPAGGAGISSWPRRSPRSPSP